MYSKNNLSWLFHKTDWAKPTALPPVSRALPGGVIFEPLLN